MTYCLGILVRDGLVMMADTRTNAGVDHISCFRKLYRFEKPGEHALAVATAGNLSVTQSVMTLVTRGMENPYTGMLDTLTSQPTLFHAAQLLGRAVREVYRVDGKILEEKTTNGFGVSFLLGGQMRGGKMHLYQIYAAGNFIEVTPETPFFQIGEHKYGKPILDRAVHFNTLPYEALRTGLVSMASTINSNMGVSLPIDVMVLPTGNMMFETVCRIDEDDPYYTSISKRWSETILHGLEALPMPPYAPEHSSTICHLQPLKQAYG